MGLWPADARAVAKQRNRANGARYDPDGSSLRSANGTAVAVGRLIWASFHWPTAFRVHILDFVAIQGAVRHAGATR